MGSVGRPRRYQNHTAKIRAYRQRQRDAAAPYAQLVLLQEAAAQEHVVAFGRLPQLAHHATAEQRTLQQEAKERDMADALWVLQTLIADFGYAEVDRYVLQHLRRP
jgi:hypothetical protein